MTAVLSFALGCLVGALVTLAWCRCRRRPELDVTQITTDTATLKQSTDALRDAVDRQPPPPVT